MISSSLIFILPLPRRKDPDFTLKLPIVKFKELGELV